MFCVRCGTSLPAQAAFCPSCGTAAPERDAAAPESPPPPPQPPAPTAPPAPVRVPTNPATLRQISWIVAAIGAAGGLAAVIAEPPAGDVPAAERSLIYAYAILISSYVCWAWYWGILRAYRSRATLFFKPMRAVTVDLWRSAGSNDPIGCVRIMFVPVIGLLAYVTFVVVIALIGWGAVAYGFFGGAILEYKRSYKPSDA